MEKEERNGRVCGVYLVLAALTVLFAVSLAFLHKTSYEVTAHGDYTVSVQEKTDEITAPTRVLVKGIGEAKLEGFRAEITLEEEESNENSGR